MSIGPSAPMLATIGGVEQILVFTATRLLGLSIDGGPAIAGGYLLVRSAAEMAAFDLRVPE